MHAAREFVRRGIRVDAIPVGTMNARRNACGDGMGRAARVDRSRRITLVVNRLNISLVPRRRFRRGRGIGRRLFFPPRRGRSSALVPPRLARSPRHNRKPVLVWHIDNMTAQIVLVDHGVKV